MVFMIKNIDEIKKIIEVCQENEIEVTRSVFYRTAEEVFYNRIYMYCSNYIISIYNE